MAEQESLGPDWEVRCAGQRDRLQALTGLALTSFLCKYQNAGVHVLSFLTQGLFQ